MNSLRCRTLALACVTFLSVLTIFILSAGRAQAGVLDTTFGSGGGASISPGYYDSPSKVFVLPNGKILIAGQTSYSSFHLFSASPMMARFNSDGTADNSFGTNGVATMPVNATVSDIIMQPDGKIVFVGGLNPGWNYPPLDFAVMRFNSDGSRDASFGNNGIVGTSIGGSYDSASGVVYLPDGKLLVIGQTSGTQTSPGAIDLVRYNSDGTLDQTFGDGGIIYYLFGSFQSTPYVYDMILQPDGKLLATGYFGFARFNQDGSFDNTFGTGGMLSTNTSVAGKMTVQPDGKIIIPVSYSDNNVYQFAMYRYHSDGTLDTSFGVNGLVETPWRSNVAGFAQATARDAAVKSNGDIVLVGSLVRINGQVQGNDTSAVGVALYTASGTLIAKTAVAFPPYQSYGTAAAVQPDGKIIAAGYSQNFYTDIVVARLTTVTNDARRYKRFFDFNGDTYTELMIYRPGVGSTPSVWYNFNGSTSPSFGQEGDIITPADYNDDGVTDIAVFRPSTGTWYISSNNDDPINHFTAVQWGAAGDIPVAADYDGDGKADVGVFRPSNGYWYILYSGDNTVKIVPFGVSGDRPVVGDYDGDGRCDIAVFRPSNGTWYITNIVTGQYQIVQFGANGDIPAQNDFNGDGKTDLVLFRPSTGIWYTSTDPAINYGAVPFGRNGDIPVVGDYDADGKADIAVWRPSNRSWYVRRSTDGSVFAQQWGATTDIPVPGN